MSMIKTEVTKEMREVAVKHHKLSDDIAKDIAIKLLQGKENVISWERESSWDGNSETVELILPDGYRLTIEREGF